jgi:hydrogenase maturation protein HypF
MVALPTCERLRVALYGAVQGVGFRPFVYRLATEMGLNGWVLNSAAGLTIELDGTRQQLKEFLGRLEWEKPRSAVVLARETSILAPGEFTRFEIVASDDAPEKTAGILPDLATCPKCLAEVLDPANRRHEYPFTNCTECGPRYTIIDDLPYDRPRTTMRHFALCPDCIREFTDPSDRRFHAQPNACPKCGPKLNAGIAEAAKVVRSGGILALKGIGGFQLMVNARREDAVARLRQLKHRDAKPFALMMPSMDMVRAYCLTSPEEEAALQCSAAPIVLLRPRSPKPGEPGALALNVAEYSPFIGVMLPYSPLHHLLSRELPFPLVATSGNRSDEPIAIENEEAQARLGGIADFFLMHDRPIARPCDDSVVRVARGREILVRRARGYAPLPVRVPMDLPKVLAVGGHLKNTVAIGVGRQVFVSQHIGDLDMPEARGAFERAIADLCRLYSFQPDVVACDLHPDYASTRWALESGLPVVRLQHHQAHVAGCAAENDIRGPYLGVGWDGTGYGLDGSIWGGEMFLVEDGVFERVSHLRCFRLPGGEAAVREGWRSAVGLRWEIEGAAGLAELPERAVFERMLERGLNAPLTSSAGRLFDGVAALAGVASQSRFEGQAAMLLERSLEGVCTDQSYPLMERADGVADWGPMIQTILEDKHRGAAPGWIAARFHNALAGWIGAVARRTGVSQVALSGGVFQNSYLVDRTVFLLEREGYAVFTHQRVPANDGGIALGQAVMSAFHSNRPGPAQSKPITSEHITSEQIKEVRKCV